jgi:Protein of unknown function (DUF3307)
MNFGLNPSVQTLPVVGFFAFFTVKHLLADYMLQTAAMVAGKEAARQWLLPLSIHAAIHAGGTFLLVIATAPAFWWLAPADFLVHATIDRIKAVIGRRGGWHPKDYRFWWLHGADQTLHHLTHFAFVLVLSGAIVLS